MLILLTNDDGIQAPGLNVLRKTLSEIAEIVVVAPDRERSATGHGITVYYPIRVDEFCFIDGKERGWVVDGTPADSVKLAICALLDRPPDLVVSGINRGPNLGTDVLYSGTVSAALEGTVLGVPSLAVSLDTYESQADYSYAAAFTRELCEHLLKEGLSPDILLNINVPALPPHKIAGVKFTKLGIRRYDDVFTARKDPRGKTYFWLAGEVVDEEQDEDTDVMAVKNRFVSITPLHFDLTNYRFLRLMREKWKDFAIGLRGYEEQTGQAGKG